MLSIKDTISRLGRSIRKVDSLSKSNKPRHNYKHATNTIGQPKVISRSHKDLPTDKLHQLKPLYTDFQRKVFQDYLKPLGMPNLKTFNTKERYDNVEAKKNWVKKSSKAPQDVLDIYIKHRYEFEKLVDYLLKITPTHLKNIDYSNELQVRRILHQEEIEHQSMKKCNLPHNIFHEIPPMPSPLTPENFEEYIYKLTHSTYHYKNSLSLQSGIIPQILLYTHKLSNDEFKPFRSTVTFNHLIRYFGYNKNQSLFARELLLVMDNEGHAPNFETINNLLAVVKVHSRIRSNTSSYVLAMKYLLLGEKLEIPVNLLTWTRIYEIIDNVYLKEQYLNIIQENGIPILRLLLLRILDDFAKTTKNTDDLVFFIENDLGIKNWQQDNLVKGRVIYYLALNTGEKLAQSGWNEFDFKSWLQGMKQNKNFTDKKSLIMLSNYFSRDFDISESLPIFSIIIEQLVTEFQDIMHLKQLLFVVRGLVYEATNQLNMPIEIGSYGEGNYSLPENYKILARNLNDALPELQARVEFINKFSFEKLQLPWEWLGEDEVAQWEALKENFKTDPTVLFAEIENTSVIPREEIDKIKKHIKAKGFSNRNRDRVEMVTQGFDKFTINTMQERGLV